MQNVLVVGLGEIGGTVFSILRSSDKFNMYGIDLDETKMQEYDANEPLANEKDEFSGELGKKYAKIVPIDVMHICIPVSSKSKFLDTASSLIVKYQPKLIIINSTVPIGTTMDLQKRCDCLVAHSPCRGVHKNREYMIQEFRRWTKYVGGATPEAGSEAQSHFREAGLKTKMLSSCNDTEFAKLFETTYRTWMIVFFQKMARLARGYSLRDLNVKIDFDQTVDFIEDTHRIRHDRPVMFPDVIGGHCLLPNSKLLLEELEPEMLKLITESNTKRIEEMKNPEVAEETKKVSRRVGIFENDQDRQVAGS